MELTHRQARGPHGHLAHPAGQRLSGRPRLSGSETLFFLLHSVDLSSKVQRVSFSLPFSRNRKRSDGGRGVRLSPGTHGLQAFPAGFLDECRVLCPLAAVSALFQTTAPCVLRVHSLGLRDGGLQADVPTEVGRALRLLFRMYRGELCSKLKFLLCQPGGPGAKAGTRAPVPCICPPGL